MFRHGEAFCRRHLTREQVDEPVGVVLARVGVCGLFIYHHCCALPWVVPAYDATNPPSIVDIVPVSPVFVVPKSRASTHVVSSSRCPSRLSTLRLSPTSLARVVHALSAGQAAGTSGKSCTSTSTASSAPSPSPSASSPPTLSPATLTYSATSNSLSAVSISASASTTPCAPPSPSATTLSSTLARRPCRSSTASAHPAFNPILAPTPNPRSNAACVTPGSDFAASTPARYPSVSSVRRSAVTSLGACFAGGRLVVEGEDVQIGIELAGSCVGAEGRVVVPVLGGKRVGGRSGDVLKMSSLSLSTSLLWLFGWGVVGMGDVLDALVMGDAASAGECMGGEGGMSGELC